MIRESESAMSLAHAKTEELKQQVFARHRQATSKKKHGRGPKSTTVAAYTGVFLLVMSMVAIGYQPPQKMDSVANVVATQSDITSTTDKPSVDQLVATNVAAGVAERAELPVAANVANLSASLSIASQLAQSNDAIVSKPQIVQPTADSRSIEYYTAKAGDTVQKIANRYGVSATTIKWANDLNSDAVEKGRKLMIPPVDGVVYTVQSGDTITSIARKYRADKERLVTFNDLELSGLTKGRKIIIPGGALPTDERPGYVAPQASQNYSGGSGFRISAGMASASVGNRYAFGNCTYYAYERRVQLGLPVGSFWGNANTWDDYARAAGMTVNSQPTTGAVLVDNAGYFGHVAIVERVNSDGSIYITEMNNYAYGGFNIVNGRTIIASQVGAYQYIH